VTGRRNCALQRGLPCCRAVDESFSSGQAAGRQGDPRPPCPQPNPCVLPPPCRSLPLLRLPDLLPLCPCLVGGRRLPRMHDTTHRTPHRLVALAQLCPELLFLDHATDRVGGHKALTASPPRRQATSSTQFILSSCTAEPGARVRESRPIPNIAADVAAPHHGSRRRDQAYRLSVRLHRQ
jgi:hypothetical protein